MSKYSCQSIKYYWCNRTLQVGSNLWKMLDSCILSKTFLYVCKSVCECVRVCARVHACLHYLYVCICVFVSVCLPVVLAGCHVAHLLLSSCLTLGLSWISLGLRWQWSRQHRFGSCHMGRLQGNGAVSISSELQALLLCVHRRCVCSLDWCVLY